MPTYQEFIADQNARRATAQQGLAGAQGNLANAKANLGRMANGPLTRTAGGALDTSGFDRAQAQEIAAGNTLSGIQGNIAQYDPNSAENQAAGNKYQAYDLARGGVSRITNDPTDQFIRTALQTAAGPDGGPYNAATRNAMFTGAMESSGAKAQAQSIMDSAAQRGMSVNDPSVQAALRNVQGQQAQAGQRARLGIDTVANPANYAAQQSAVNRLGDYNTGKQQQTQSAEDRLREMLWNEGFNKGAPQPQVAGAGNSMQIGGPATPATAPSGPWMGFTNGGTGGNGWVAPKPMTTPATAAVSAPQPPVARPGGLWTATGPAQTVNGFNAGGGTGATRIKPINLSSSGY